MEPSVSLDDIEHMIETGTEEGVLESVEQRVAHGGAAPGRTHGPRRDAAADRSGRPRREHSADEVIGAVAMAGFSRLPVYEGDLDHIIGFVHIKDLFRQIYLGWQIELRKLLKPALFVPESMPLDRLLELFQEQHNQLAVVLDEYGGTEGMVTLEDVIERAGRRNPRRASPRPAAHVRRARRKLLAGRRQLQRRRPDQAARSAQPMPRSRAATAPFPA